MARRASIEVYTPVVVDDVFTNKVNTLLHDYFPAQIYEIPEEENDIAAEDMIVSRRNNHMLDVIPPKDQRDKIIFLPEQRLHIGRVTFENDRSRLKSKVGQVADNMMDQLEELYPEVDYIPTIFDKADTVSLVSRRDPRNIQHYLAISTSRKKLNPKIPDIVSLLESALDSRSSPMYDRRFITRALSHAVLITRMPPSVVNSDILVDFMENIREILPVDGLVEVGKSFSDEEAPHLPVVET